MAEAAKAIAADNVAKERAAEDQVRLNKLDLNYLNIIDEITGVEQRRAAVARTALIGEQAKVITTKAIPAMGRLRREFSDLDDSEWSFASTSQKVAAIIDSSTTKSMESSLGSILGVIAGKRVEAAFNAVYYGAEGAVHIAESIYPFNAALLARGIGEVAASAEYAMAAGVGGHSGGGYRSGGGGGSVSYSRGDVSPYRTGASEGGQGQNPSTLAPGAAGSGSRFGGQLHVIVVGDAQAGQWLAGTLNRAVNRGVTLNATSSQRGTPVGH
jgi:hypothetical protein